MDPQELLFNLLEDLSRNDREGASEKAGYLRELIDRGMFLPTVERRSDVDGRTVYAVRNGFWAKQPTAVLRHGEVEEEVDGEIVTRWPWIVDINGAPQIEVFDTCAEAVDWVKLNHPECGQNIRVG